MAFTHVAARMLAEPPKAALLFGVLQTNSLPPSPAPTATGWSDSCRAGFAPSEEWRFNTAHGEVGLARLGVEAPAGGYSAMRGKHRQRLPVQPRVYTVPR